MKIGICSPFMPHDLADLLDEGSQRLLTGIKGVTATPVTPLARELLDKGHEVSVFCLDPSIGAPMLLTGHKLVIHALPKRRFRASALDFYRKERVLIREAIERERPDVISAQWSYEHALGALDSGVPTVVTCHDTPLRYAWISKTFFMAYHVVIAAMVFRRANKLIAVSPYTARHIRKLFRPPYPPEVIPNGLAMEIFQRGELRLQREPDKRDTFNICCVGGWGRIKNVTSLLEAFRLIRQSEPTARLYLFGSGLGEGQEAHTWAKSRGLHEGVVFKGRAQRHEILDFLASDIDLMIHPSLIECHPMVLIEAIACGVPVLAGADSGGVAWTLYDVDRTAGYDVVLVTTDPSKGLATGGRKIDAKTAAATYDAAFVGKPMVQPNLFKGMGDRGRMKKIAPDLFSDSMVEK